MAEITTNRDLYCFIAEVIRRWSDRGVTLATYLSNLRALARVHSGAATLTPAEVAQLLEAAFDSNGSARAGTPDGPPADGYLEWDALLDEQLRDLAAMEADGTLASDDRYYGANAPSGARWSNFDPCTFLECGAAGTFGGWQEGDDTGRALVPGPVTVVNESGDFESVDPCDIVEPVVALPGFSWHALVALLHAGQVYE